MECAACGGMPTATKTYTWKNAEMSTRQLHPASFTSVEEPVEESAAVTTFQNSVDLRSSSCDPGAPDKPSSQEETESVCQSVSLQTQTQQTQLTQQTHRVFSSLQANIEGSHAVFSQ